MKITVTPGRKIMGRLAKGEDLLAALAEAGFELQGRLEQKLLGILAVAVKPDVICGEGRGGFQTRPYKTNPV